MNILIIANEEILINEIKHNCINQNYNIINCNDISNIDEIIKNNNIDIIIMDIDCLEENKIDTFKYIKSINNDPIIVISSTNITDDIVLYFSLGADDYITKPFSVKELIMRIQVIYNKSTKQFL